jgi:hypothetical protein
MDCGSAGYARTYLLGSTGFFFLGEFLSRIPQ